MVFETVALKPKRAGTEPLAVASGIRTQAENLDLLCVLITDHSACSVIMVGRVFIPLATASGSVAAEPTFWAKLSLALFVSGARGLHEAVAYISVLLS